MFESSDCRANFLDYHRTLEAELTAIKDRLRYLIRHWPTDGGFKEAALRAVLRRHLPEMLQIGTGFIVNRSGEYSTQIDILVVDRSHPTLFKDGDLLIVTPSAVRAIIEVKTTLSGRHEWESAVRKLIKCKSACGARGASHDPYRIFTGLFVYERRSSQENNIINAVASAYSDANEYVDAVSFGKDVFGFQPYRPITLDHCSVQHNWLLGRVERLAPSYFISSLLNRIDEWDMMDNRTIWFPEPPDRSFSHGILADGSTHKFNSPAS